MNNRIKTFCCLALILSQRTDADEYQFRVLSNSLEPLKNVVISAGPALAEAPTGQEIMNQVNRKFAPYVLSVTQGQGVTFPNSDNVRHHVYSFSPAKMFELKLYSGKPKAPITFNELGTVVIGCNIHDNMVGYIYVTNKTYRATSDNTGKVNIVTQEFLSEVTLWHPNLSLDSQTELALKLSDLEQKDGIYQISLKIPTPNPDPQGVTNSAKDNFKQFIRD